MRVKDFTFDLPPELIAREPLARRDSSRLMVIDRINGTVSERIFKELPALVNSGDLLVMNDTRVIPARIFGNKESGGRVELFLLRRQTGTAECWECLLRAAKRFRTGQHIILSGGMSAVVAGRAESGNWYIEFAGTEDFAQWLSREGHMPLPPYFQRDDAPEDRERYQTVVARTAGAVAAPTAGLHFTQQLLAELGNNGVETAFVTLHTGLGTFQPVRAEFVEEHQIHSEYFEIPPETAAAVARTKAAGGRVIAVGTTSARTLEYSAQQYGEVTFGSGEADIFIYPGYQFKVVDALITNFHLPESTLLMLVSAFAGFETIMKAYQQAIVDKFRFYSYGDAMFIS